MNWIPKVLLPVFAVFALVHHVNGQEINYSMAGNMPMTLNPAYTGMIRENVRANAIYRNSWRGVTLPYTSMGVSVDAPVLTMANGDYIGVGLLVTHDKAGDGTLKNSAGLASVSYHKLFGNGEQCDISHGYGLSIGLQGGYIKRTLDLSQLYFNSTPQDTSFPATYSLGEGNSVDYYNISAGIAFSQAIGRSFNYVIGVKANNLNQPSDALLKKQNSIVGLGRTYVVSSGCNVRFNEKMTLKPATFVYVTETTTGVVVGSNFQYEMLPAYRCVALLCGVWYRTGDMVVVNAGLAFRGFNFMASYDYSISTLNSSSNGNGAFEIAIGANLGKQKRFKYVPCNRF